MKALALISQEAGAGRTFLAANLSSLLKGPVALLELGEAASSELSLHLGMASSPFTETSLTGTLESRSLFSSGHERGAPAFGLPAGEGWLLVDGLTLASPGWEAWLEWCGRGLWVERGDLVGGRRASRSLRMLDERHFSRAGLCLAWTPSFPAQPMPDLPGLTSHALPEFPRAAERLAQALPAAQSDPSSPFVKAAKALAQSLEILPAMPSRKKDVLLVVASPRRPEAEPKGIDEEESLLRRCLDSLRQELNLKKIEAAELTSPRFRENWTPKTRQMASVLLAQEHASWLTREVRADLVEKLVCLVLGLGPLEALLADPDVTEIMVNSHDQVYAERRGKIALSPVKFWDDAQLMQVIERIVAPLGRRIDESSPRVDARLPDGSRVNAIIPPLALKGPCLTIRKFSQKRISIEEMVRSGSLSAPAASFLKSAVLHRKNIVVSGGTGSGKTTLLNALSSFIPDDERIITVEDSAELKLDQPHVVSLEARPKNLEGKGEVSIRDLVTNCLRMRPDRIVVGECRGGEALDMLQAMNTGHDGSLTTVHANSSRDALSRIETLCLMSDVSLPLSAVRRQLASAVQFVVQIARMKDGTRRVTAITEICGIEGDTISSQDIFEFRQLGEDASGQIVGELKASGIAAGFYGKAKAQGHVMDFGVFIPN